MVQSDENGLLCVARPGRVAFCGKDDRATQAGEAGRLVAVLLGTAELEARIELFVRLELLRPILDKKHQSRYVLRQWSRPSWTEAACLLFRAAPDGQADSPFQTGLVKERRSGRRRSCRKTSTLMQTNQTTKSRKPTNSRLVG
jgi:hypothetical protein